MLTKVTYSMIQNAPADVLDYGAVGNGVANDTVAIQAALDSGATFVVVPAGTICGVTSLTMVAGQTLILNGTLKKLSGTTPTVVMGAGCTINGGGEIDGNSVASADAISADNVDDISVADLYIHDVGGVGIHLKNLEKYNVSNNRIEDITGQGINLFFADSGIVTNNYIDTAQHGVQFWGGDAALYPLTYTNDITITGNVVKNVVAGLWGSRGRRITIAGNTATICSDVGVDFEGCIDCSATGNTVSNCDNAGLAMFYRSTNCVFAGNAVLVDAASGNQYGIWLTADFNNHNAITGNTVRVSVAGGYAIYADEGGEYNLFSGNTLAGVDGETADVRIFNQANVNFSSNMLLDCRLRVEGTYKSKFCDNFIVRDQATDAAAQVDAPVYVYWASSTWNGQANTVNNNTVENWSYPIVDDCGGDNASYNDCSYNRVSGVMYHRGTSGWYGRMASNVLTSNPNTAATVSSY